MAREECEWRRAADGYAELIELNNNDNLGCRYSLAACLLQLDDRDALSKLFVHFEDEVSAFMLYTRALAAFKYQGADSKAAVGFAQQAAAGNKYVPELLSVFDGYKYELDMYTVGTQTEAMAYSDLFGEIWDDTPGAVDWLFKAARPARKTRASAANKARKTKQAE